MITYCFAFGDGAVLCYGFSGLPDTFRLHLAIKKHDVKLEWNEPRINVWSNRKTFFYNGNQRPFFNGYIRV